MPTKKEDTGTKTATTAKERTSVATTATDKVSTHKVNEFIYRKGDELHLVATKNGISLGRLLDANKIDRKTMHVRDGKHLTIPAKI